MTITIQKLLCLLWISLLSIVVYGKTDFHSPYEKYKKQLLNIYDFFQPGLHIPQRIINDKKKSIAMIRLAKQMGCAYVTIDIKSSGQLTRFDRLKAVRRECRKQKLKIVGRWVMFKYWKNAPCAFRSMSGGQWRGENCEFSNPVFKHSWDYNFYGIYKHQNKRVRRYGLVHYLKYVDEMELDYIRYPTRNLSTVNFHLDAKTIRANLSKINVPKKRIDQIIKLNTNLKKQQIMLCYVDYYFGKKEFQSKFSLDIIGSSLLQCQNIGQHDIIGRYSIRPMLYLDSLHIPKRDLLFTIQTHLNKKQSRYNIDDLYYLATYAYLKAGIHKYKGRDYRSSIVPYIKGWHNNGESSYKTLAEFVGQLKALKAHRLRRFTIWSISHTVTRLLLDVNKARDIKIAQKED